MWISFALFESDLPDREEDDEAAAGSSVEAARTVFSRGSACPNPIPNPNPHSYLTCSICRRYDALKSQGLKEERMLLLEAWRDLEEKSVSRPGYDPNLAYYMSIILFSHLPCLFDSFCCQVFSCLFLNLILSVCPAAGWRMCERWKRNCLARSRCAGRRTPVSWRNITITFSPTTKRKLVRRPDISSVSFLTSSQLFFIYFICYI